MHFKRLIFACFASLALSAAEPEAEASWDDIARQLTLDPEGTVGVRDGQVVSLANDGNTIVDSAVLNESQLAAATRAMEGEDASSTRDLELEQVAATSKNPRAEAIKKLQERQGMMILCRTIRCRVQRDCTVYPQCFLCRNPAFTCG